ncbi:MAG: protein phosphatase 2C domain-containing protein, partial [Helicobacteraceae bacterium]|nr:protein phosphatase 2C domain-containing protein [Helicobacteraceae bacterium]
QSLPYRKDHTEHKIIASQENDFCVIAASRRGRSHEHSGSFRDDDFFIDCNNGWSALIVADGAGSAKLSRAGSKEASDAIGRIIIDKLKGEEGKTLSDLIIKWDSEAQKTVHGKIYNLFQSAAKNAVESIETASKNYGGLPRDLATTLLAAISKKIGDKLFVASFWVGDGAIGAYRPNAKTDKIKILGIPDEGEYSGQTRFLDRSILSEQTGFNNRIRIGLLTDVKALILMTDGVSDPIFETDNGLNDPKKWDDFWQEIAPLLSGEKSDEKLLDWLAFWSQGNHDDRTIVIQSFGK